MTLDGHELVRADADGSRWYKSLWAPPIQGEEGTDVAALRDDPAMAPLVAERQVPVILMHMLGTPKTMQQDPRYGKRLFVHTDTILNHDLMLELTGICDVVFHLAAAVGVQYILDNPLKSIKINVEGTEKVLELCAKFKKRVLITSSSEVYGKSSNAPFAEDDDLVLLAGFGAGMTWGSALLRWRQPTD